MLCGSSAGGIPGSAAVRVRLEAEGEEVAEEKEVAGEDVAAVGD